VVSDVAHYALTGFPSWIDGVQYIPLSQTLFRSAQNSQFTMFVKTSNPIQAAAVMNDVVKRRFGGVAVSRVASLERIRTDSTVEQRSTTALLAFFAGLGLLLGTGGVYGVISHRTAQRKREIGIRMALGGSAGRMLGMILSETLIVALLGCAAGLAAAYTLSRFLASMLFGITTHDPVAFAICPSVLLVAALLAAAIPGRRAAQTDPALTLRED
jgi:ABC-type antimicrobial peptide transport system permease subunit